MDEIKLTLTPTEAMELSTILLHAGDMYDSQNKYGACEVAMQLRKKVKDAQITSGGKED